MLFNSYTFIIFFALVLLVTTVIGNWTARKAFLLIVSYVFYAAWNPPFVLLLWISTIIDWFVSRWVYASKMSPPNYFPAIFFGIESCHCHFLRFFPFKYFNCIFFEFGSYSSCFWNNTICLISDVRRIQLPVVEE